jgi:hypothetical protein
MIGGKSQSFVHIEDAGGILAYRNWYVMQIVNRIRASFSVMQHDD